MKINAKPQLFIVLMYTLMIIFTVLAIFPLLWLLLQSFKTTQEYLNTSKLSLPKQLFLKNYHDAWIRGNFSVLFFNSILYTLITSTSVIILGFMAGFAFAKIKNKATGFLHNAFIIGILLTLQSIMIPLFLMVHAAGLYDTRIGILIPYIGIALPLGVYLSTDYIKSIPESIIESARLDGAGYIKIFFTLIIQISTPAAITVAIMTVVATWNEFMLINILASKESIKSLPVGVAKFSGALASDYGKQFAALVISSVPMIIFYLIFRKKIVQGMASGAVKG